MASDDSTSGKPRQPWRSIFQQSTTALFLVNNARKLRYANPACITLFGKPYEAIRGMRVTPRKSSSHLSQTLAAPAEVWRGESARVRRTLPNLESGPPWWDIQFIPLMESADRVKAVIGIVKQTSIEGSRSRSVPGSLATVRQRHAEGFTFDRFAATTPGSHHRLAQARLAAKLSTPVWINGEAGTGKETLARIIHHNGANRERGFVGLDCLGLQPYLAEGLFFGKAGLITSGQLGTLYLKEPQALARDLQDRLTTLLLRPRSALPRLICGSTMVPENAVQAGTLLPTFQTHFSTLRIELLPLRQRLGDLPKLIDAILPDAKLSDNALSVLNAHDWPGNLRELSTVLRSASARAQGTTITENHLPRRLREAHLIETLPPQAKKPTWTLDGVLAEVERRLIADALAKTNQSQTEAAKLLGVPRARLWRKTKG